MQRPIRRQFEFRLGGGGRRVVVGQGHRLPAAVDDGLLGKRGVDVTYRRTGVVDPAVDPGVEDRRAGLDVVGVALEVVNHDVLLGGEAPDPARPRGDRFRLVDLIHPPVVRLAQHKPFGAVIVLGDRSDQGGAVDDGLLIGAETHLMRSGFAAGTPVQCSVDVDARGSVGRLRTSGPDGLVKEADLAEAALPCRPVGAVNNDADEPGANTGEIHRRIVRVCGFRGRLGKLEVAESGPRSAVLGVLDRHVFEPETKHLLEFAVVIPHPHFRELVDGIELVLDVGRLGARRHTQPRFRRLERVQAVLVEAGAVDGILRSGPIHRRGVAGGDDVLDRIEERLGREGPHRPGEDRVGRGVDLIDAPVIGLPELQQAGRIVGRAALALTGQDSHCVGPAGGADRRRIRAEVHVVRRRIRAGGPAQHAVTNHVDFPIGRDRRAGRGLTFCQRLQHDLVVVDHRSAVGEQIDHADRPVHVVVPHVRGEQRAVVVLLDRVVVQIDEEPQLDPLVVHDRARIRGVRRGDGAVGQIELRLDRPVLVGVVVVAVEQDEPGRTGAAGRNVLHGGHHPHATGHVELVHQVGGAGNRDRIAAAVGERVGDGCSGRRIIVPTLPSALSVDGAAGDIGLETFVEHAGGGDRSCTQHEQSHRRKSETSHSTHSSKI